MRVAFFGTKVSDVMTSGVKIVSPDTTLQEAASKMKSADSGFLPIGSGDRLVGTITDRDIVLRAVAEGKDPKSTTVQDAMSKDVVYCFDDQDLDEVKKVMGEKQIRRMPVMNRDKRLVGVLSLGDLAGNTSVNEAVDKISKETGRASQTEGKKHP